MTFVSPFPRSVTEIADIRFISAGSGNNLLVKLMGHLTINANGDVTVNNLTSEQSCVG